jgi:hypothetical protein
MTSPPVLGDVARPVDLRSTPAGGTEPFQPVSPLVVKGVRVTAAPLAIHEVVPAS